MDLPAILLIDLQPRILDALPGRERILRRACFLAQAAALFDLPVLASEQVPAKLGPSDPALRALLPASPGPLPKSSFSAAALHPLPPAKPVIVAGIETHICVRQTVLDLLAADHPVTLAVDAIGARHPLDHDLALRELAARGALLSTSETLAFAWCTSADHPAFRALSTLVRDSFLPPTHTTEPMATSM